MEESEEGVSQLGSLKYTQAEANAIEEKFSTMLQVQIVSLRIKKTSLLGTGLQGLKPSCRVFRILI